MTRRTTLGWDPLRFQGGPRCERQELQLPFEYFWTITGHVCQNKTNLGVHVVARKGVRKMVCLCNLRGGFAGSPKSHSSNTGSAYMSTHSCALDHIDFINGMPLQVVDMGVVGRDASGRIRLVVCKCAFFRGR